MGASGAVGAPKRPSVICMSTQTSHRDVVSLLEARLRELLDAGTTVDQLTPELVLGPIEAELAAVPAPPEGAPLPPGQSAAISRDDTRFVRELRHKASRTRRSLFVAANGLGVFFPTNLTPLSAETGQAIADAVGEVGARLQIGILFEEKPLRGRAPQIWIAPGWLRVFVLALSEYAGATRYIGDARHPFKERRLVRTESSVNLSSYRVAALEADRRQLRLHAHPFAGERGAEGWQVSPEGTTLIERIITQALTLNVDPQVKCRYQAIASAETEQASARLDAARQALSLVRPLAEIQQQSIPRRLAELNERETAGNRQIVEAQRSLLALLAAKQAIAQERAMLDVERRSMDSETIIRAAREAARIAAMGSIREVGVIDVNGVPNLKVTWHPCVLSSSGSSRRLIAPLTLHIPVTSGNGVNHVTCPNRGRVHPHISTSGSICWGQASAPLQQALARSEYAAAVLLITRWVHEYNGNSPYVSLSEFPSTTLSVGFHPEV